MQATCASCGESLPGKVAVKWREHSSRGYSSAWLWARGFPLLDWWVSGQLNFNVPWSDGHDLVVTVKVVCEQRILKGKDTLTVRHTRTVRTVRTAVSVWCRWLAGYKYIIYSVQGGVHTADRPQIYSKSYSAWQKYYFSLVALNTEAHRQAALLEEWYRHPRPKDWICILTFF